jgi:hypothetical protein
MSKYFTVFKTRSVYSTYNFGIFTNFLVVLVATGVLTVARCQGHNVVGAKGVRSNLVFSTLSFLPCAHPRGFFNVTNFGNFMPN